MSGTHSHSNPHKTYDFSHFIEETLNQLLRNTDTCEGYWKRDEKRLPTKTLPMIPISKHIIVKSITPDEKTVYKILRHLKSDFLSPEISVFSKFSEKLKMLITPSYEPVDDFWHHFWNIGISAVF